MQPVWVDAFYNLREHAQLRTEVEQSNRHRARGARRVAAFLGRTVSGFLLLACGAMALAWRDRLTTRARIFLGMNTHIRHTSLVCLMLLLTARSSCFPALPSASFHPSYEWSEVPDGVSVPAGLEIRLVLHGEEASDRRKPRLARIPTTWRLDAWLDEEHFFARVDVQRSTPIADIEAAMSAQAIARHQARRGRGDAASAPSTRHQTECSVTLSSNGVRLPPGSTAEAVGLFGKQRTLVPRLSCHGHEAQR